MIMFNLLKINAQNIGNELTIQKNIDETFNYISDNDIVLSDYDDIKLACINNEIYDLNVKYTDDYSILLNNNTDILSNNNYAYNIIKNVTIGNIYSILNLNIYNIENLNKVVLKDIIIHKLNDLNCSVEATNVNFSELNNEFFYNSYFDRCIFNFGEMKINNKTILKDCILSNIRIEIVGSIEIYNSKLYNVEITGGTCLLNGCECQNVRFDNTIIKGFSNTNNYCKIINSSYTSVNDNIHILNSKNGNSIRIYDSNIDSLSGSSATYNIENTNIKDYKISGDISDKKTVYSTYKLFNITVSLYDNLERNNYYICCIPEDKLRSENDDFELTDDSVFGIYNKYNEYLKYYIEEIDDMKYLFVKNIFIDYNDIITMKEDLSTEISYKDDVIFNYLYVCNEKDIDKFNINYDNIVFENNMMKLNSDISGKIDYLLNENESVDIIFKNENNYPIKIKVNINDKIYNNYELNISNNKILIGE